MLISCLLLVFLTGFGVFAEPPPAYGPPGYSSGFRPSTGFGGSGGGGGYSGGEGGAPEPFDFKYEVKDPQSGNDYSHRASSSDGKRVTGEYQVLLPDGRRQIVKYTADDNGYNADVKYEGQARYPQGGGGGGYSGGSGGYSGGSGGYSSGGSGGGFGGYSY